MGIWNTKSSPDCHPARHQLTDWTNASGKEPDASHGRSVASLPDPVGLGQARSQGAPYGRGGSILLSMVSGPLSSATPPGPVPSSAPPRRRGRPGYDVGSLVDKAVEVFTVKGFDGTSMEDLSHQLGISKSAIYHHVTSKDELLELAISRALDDLSRTVEENQRLNASAIERIESLIRASVMVLIAQKPFVTLLLRVRGNTEVERRALERRRVFDRYVARLVVEAIREGSVRPDTDPALTARLIFGMVNSLTDWIRPPTDTEARALGDAICATAFEGIRTREC